MTAGAKDWLLAYLRHKVGKIDPCSHSKRFIAKLFLQRFCDAVNDCDGAAHRKVLFNKRRTCCGKVQISVSEWALNNTKLYRSLFTRLNKTSLKTEMRNSEQQRRLSYFGQMSKTISWNKWEQGDSLSIDCESTKIWTFLKAEILCVYWIKIRSSSVAI